MWSVANTAVSKIGGLAIGVVLARLLGPEQFGTFAVAMVALMAVLSFNELGVSLAIVRWREDPRVIAPTVTTISVTGSVLFSAAGYVTAPWFAGAMGSPEATDVVRLMLLAVVINGLVASPAALLQREFRQGTRTAIDQVNTWLGATVSVVLALLGAGAMSLAIGRLAGAAVSAVMFIAVSPLPLRFGFDRRYVGRLLRFGLPLAGASVAVFAIGYVDQLVVGAVLGTTALGLYVLAVNLASWPVTLFSQPLRSVAPAVFARMQHDARALGDSFRAVFRALNALALPTCLVIAGSAGPIIALVYGTAWLPAAYALRWLAVFAAVRIVFELSYDYLVVVRRTGWILFVQLVWIAAVSIGVWLGTRRGIEGVAFAQAVVGVSVVLPLYLWGVKRAGVELGSALARSTVPLAVGLVAGGAALGVSAAVPGAAWSFALCFVVGLGALGLSAFLDRASFREVMGTWRDRGASAPRDGESDIAKDVLT